MYHIIINPASRSGKGILLWKEQVEPALHEAGVEYRSYFSLKAGDVSAIVKQVLRGHPDIPLQFIILGGDGTVNEFLQDLDEPERITLGYIPTGSSNDLARDLNIPKDPLEALKLILHAGTPTPMDVGTVTYEDGKSRRFAVSCGMGFDAAVCEEVSHSKLKVVMNKLGLGKLTYLGIALKELCAARKISASLQLDSQDPISIGNMLFTCAMLHRYEGGGFMFAPKADFNDGLLDLCVVGDVSKLLILTALPTAFFGKHFMFKGITPYRTKTLTLKTDSPMWVHTDGEVISYTNEITITCGEHKIQIIH